MKLITLTPEIFSKDKIKALLEEYEVFTNRYAETYFSHTAFVTETAVNMSVLIVSLAELGFENGATLNEILRKVSESAEFEPCPPNAGLFLRFAWKDQPESRNSVLRGTHEAPDLSVTVLSEPLEKDDSFPKGLYLRNVDGKNWLRGYVCDSEYRFPRESLFAIKKK